MRYNSNVEGKGVWARALLQSQSIAVGHAKSIVQPLMTSRSSVLVAFAIALAVFALTHFAPIPGGLKALAAASGGQPLLDLQPVFSSDEVYRRLDAFGEAGRAAYRWFTLTTDVVFPLTLAAFLYLFAKSASQQFATTLRTFLPVVPIVWFALDMTENFSIFALLSHYPERFDFLAATLGYVTAAKRVALAAAAGVPILLLVILAVRRLLHPRPPG